MTRKKKEEIKPKAKPKTKAKAKVKAKVKPKKKMGRPSKFDNIDMEQVKKLVHAGFTDIQMADFYEVSITTWKNWKKNNDDFLASLKDWKSEADSEIEKSLYQRAKGYTYYEEMEEDDNGRIKTRKTKKFAPPDATSMIFWLKNRQPQEWRDKRENTLSGPDGGPVQVTEVQLLGPDE